MSTGQIVGGIVGAAIGFFAGAGPQGALMGWTLGSGVGALIDPPVIEGPRRDDLKVQASEYGKPIPYLFGVKEAAGNVNWASELIPVEGGGSGKGGAEQKTTSYLVHFEVWIAGNPRALGRVWAGPEKRLVRDLKGKTESGTIRFYSGAGLQLPDPLVESFEGVGEVPGDRGICKLVWENYNTENDGNMLPFLTIETGKAASETVTSIGITSFVRVFTAGQRLYYVYRGSSTGVLVRDLPSDSVVRHLPTEGTSWPVDLNAYSVADAEFTMLEGIAGLTFSVIDFNTGVRTFYPLVPPIGADADLGNQIFGHGYVNGKYVIATKGATVGRVGIWIVDPADPSTVEAAYASNTGAGTAPALMRVPTSGENAIFVVSPGRLTKHPIGPAPAVVNLGALTNPAPSQCEVDPYTGRVWTAGMAPPGVNALVTVTVHDPATGILHSDTNSEFYFLAQNCIAFWPGVALVSGEAALSTDFYWEFAPDGSSGSAFGNGYRGTAEVHAIVYNPFLEYTGNSGPVKALWAIRTGGLVTTNQIHWTGEYPYLLQMPAQLSVTWTKYLKADTFEAEEDSFNLVDSGEIVLQKDTLDVIVRFFLNRAGLPDSKLDLSAIEGIVVDGFAATSQSSVRAIIEQLRGAYYFDLIEHATPTGMVVQAVRWGTREPVQIPDAHVGHYQAGAQPPAEPINTTRRMPNELPRTLTVEYVNRAADYAPATRYARRLVSEGEDEQSWQLPLVLSDTKAQEVAEVNLHALYVQQLAHSFTLPLDYADLEPADPVVVYGMEMKLTSTKRTPFLIECEAVSDDSAAYTPHVIVTETEPTGQLLERPGLTFAELVNINAPRDSDNDAGFIVAASRSDPATRWRGAVLHASADGGATWAAVATIANEATLGKTTEALGDFTGGNVTDESNTLRINLLRGELASTTAAGLRAGTLTLLVGREIVYGRDVSLELDGTVAVRGLLRGQRGTEFAIGSHTVGEAVILYDPAALVRVPQESADLGATRIYKCVSVGMGLSDTIAQSFTSEGAALECYAPVHLSGGRNTAGDVLLRWTRRNRSNGELRNGADVPMSEATEAYEIEIGSDAGFTTVKRTIASSTQSATYTAAQQVADFGALQPTVYFRVYQLSAIVGRGHPASASA